MIWPAPAKLNLFLHIVGRRADGYHLLQTAFQFLDYQDQLSFDVTDDGRIARASGPAALAPETDLTLRAAHLLKETTGCARGVRITLSKRIPMGSGLGGGSSDAATTLLVLNRLWDTCLSLDQLAHIGLQLGADIPVFVRGHAAIAEGVGEILTSVKFTEPWYVVITPPVHVPTAAVFADYARERQLTPYTPPRTIRDLREGHDQNDLEPVVRKHYPQVERAFEYLGAYGRPRMSGSGGSVFLNIEDAAQGERILAAKPSDFEGFVARGTNRHPLLSLAV